MTDDGLVLESLTKSFKGSPDRAVDGVGLVLPAGSCTAVLGPSGSGKSTLLRMVAGLESPDSGRVLLRGADLTGVRPEHRGMAMVSQRPLLFPHLSVLDNIAFPLTVRGARRRAARAAAAEYLELVQLDGLGSRNVTALSGGQQQRVAIARALAARPALLLLDEPFSALDQELRSAMHDLLGTLRRRLNPAVLMVTHDRDEAAAVADRIALFSAGRLLQHDHVEVLFTRPVSLQVSRLLGGVNEAAGTVRAGTHYSALGALDLPADGNWPDGEATLVIRQESISITADPGGIPATVSSLRAVGPRRLATFDAGGVMLRAEPEWGRRLAVGDRVRLNLPVPARAAVPETGTPMLRALNAGAPADFAAMGHDSFRMPSRVSKS